MAIVRPSVRPSVRSAVERAAAVLAPEPAQVAEEERPVAAVGPRTRVPAPLVHTTPPPSSKDMVVADTDEDFEGLETAVGFGSFPIMKLDKSEFVCGDVTLSATSFDAILRQGRFKYLYKSRKPKSDSDKVQLVYSYDKETTANGTPLEDVFLRWKMDGETPAGKEPEMAVYFEVVAEVFNTGTPLDGKVVLLSIPPSSVSRLSGYQVVLRTKRLKLNEVMTKVKRGPKISKSSDKTFYPWDFELVGVLDTSEE